MKKIISLIKATMTEDMNLFKVSTKKKSKTNKIIIPIAIMLLLMSVIFAYSEMIMKQLSTFHLEFALLTLSIILISFITLLEGIYKSGNLLFNCKDDNLLLSLPIKRSTVLFIRIFKFYIFELLYNSIFLLPSLIVYAKYTNPDITFYFVSFIGLLMFPIIPILLSSVIGLLITSLSSKFKVKNIIQTVITILLLLIVMYFSYNSKSTLTELAQNASSLNDIITKIYYPAGAYIDLVTNFKIIKLIEFIIINLGLFIITVLIIGKVYFNVNSNVKSTSKNKTTKDYKIKVKTPIKALIKKELNRFVNSPVFITNASFGLVLFILGCIYILFKFESAAQFLIKSNPSLTIENIKNYLPIIILAFICFTSFMTSITSSMISLEGKTINILKSLPLKPYTIIKAKVLSAILIMIPCILIGDIILFIKFNFDLLSIITIIIASIILPLISSTIGILVNLKYPRMDAKNDTEVVKQSMSSTVSVFIGLALIGITLFLLYTAYNMKLGVITIMISFVLLYTLICISLLLILKKTCEKSFDNIIV